MQLAYIALLIAVVSMAGFRFLFVRHPDEEEIVACLAVVVLNWIVNTSWVITSGNTDAVAMFMAADFASLLVVCAVRCDFSATLASTYAGQITLHFLHLLGAGDPLYYWQLLTVLAYLQFIIMAVWVLIPARPLEIEDWLT